MQEEITGTEGAEGNSGCGDPLTPEVTTESSSGRPDAIPCKRIADKKFIIAAAVVVILIIVVILLAVKKLSPPSPSFASQDVSCTDSWITYKGKYFYISKEEKNWFMSLKTCSLFNASLAVIDTQQELDYLKRLCSLKSITLGKDFWVHFLNPFDYWFGLSRETNKVWKWSNGTEFKNQ
ncbi:C-type lectin domain family 2 member D-like [Ahaetulla prasina]|uniref:C-type lectin domain family 2 member D-like n=1 Tax=Ahaetulla prasina TaxID=499056 RepID=UPI00264945ED|nr:C-type lectin domain family 2 member D-like [Ahaetulla prasina]